MAVFINSLLFLRLINLFLFFAVGIVILNRIKQDPAWKAVFLDDQNANNDTKSDSTLSWKTVDLKDPPALSDLESEAMRFNELLSKPQYKCEKLKIVGTSHDNYALCFDEKFLNDEGIFGKSLLITGMTNAPTGLEKELNVSRWEVFLPQGAAVMDAINVDIEINYLSEVADGHYFPMESIIDGISQSKYAVTKLQFYSEVMDSEKQLLKAVGRVLKVIKILQTQHLLIEIRAEPTSAVETLPMWNKLIYQLFFKHSYALLGSMSNHACSRPLRHCIYRASFAKVPLSEASGPPVWGLGSPGEERSRLLTHLTRLENGVNCSKVLESNGDVIPRVCLDHEEMDLCGVFYSPLSTKHVANMKSFFDNCDVTIHYPEPIEVHPVSKISIQSTGILPLNQPSHIVPGIAPSNQWRLQSFEQIITNFITSAPSKKYLLFDLDGDEMEVLDQIVENCDVLKKFRQIAFRFRVFFGEENTNYRRLYLRVLQLEYCGFYKVFSDRVNVSTFYVTFRRESGFVRS
uniref:Methyltransf_21 domain-containing protein n=1 Tax=Panagrellus redivivus TaxID=6233 RepID=A0A7E4VWZ8_PANRE